MNVSGFPPSERANSGAITSLLIVIVFGLLIGILGISWVFGWEQARGANYLAYFLVVFGI